MHDHEHAGNERIDPLRLPVFNPGPALWSRVVAARQRQLRRRRGGFALAAAAAIGAIAMLLPRPLPPLQQDIASGQRESRALESEWQHLAPPPQGIATDLTHLRVIDAVLQAAYDHGAAAEEVAPLWRERNQALRGLITRARSPETSEALVVTRI